MGDWPEYKSGYELQLEKENIAEEKVKDNKNIEKIDGVTQRIQCDWISCKYNSYTPEDKQAGKCQKAKIKLIANKKDNKLECKSYRKGKLNGNIIGVLL
mgnify:CR=1 FL=1